MTRNRPSAGGKVEAVRANRRPLPIKRVTATAIKKNMPDIKRACCRLSSSIIWWFGSVSKSHSLRSGEMEGGAEEVPAFASGDDTVDMNDTSPGSRSRNGDEIDFYGPHRRLLSHNGKRVMDITSTNWRRNT